ncbi:sensor histidine kinase [Rossellomorea sp. H39__3]
MSSSGSVSSCQQPTSGSSLNTRQPLPNISLFLENILSMCLKEAVTNIVKHSGATECTLRVVESHDSLRFVLSDNGKGIPKDYRKSKGSGLIGIRERLDFVNGELGIDGRRRHHSDNDRA